LPSNAGASQVAEQEVQHPCDAAARSDGRLRLEHTFEPSRVKPLDVNLLYRLPPSDGLRMSRLTFEDPMGAGSEQPGALLHETPGRTA
jgi:hypothetical protein